MKPCVPPDLKAQAEAAEKRLDDAVADLLAALDGYFPGEDPFHCEMVALIDADKAKAKERTR